MDTEGFPSQGRLLGIDYGSKRVGVAISDSEQKIAAPVCVIQRSSAQGDGRALGRIADENSPVGVVVGLPVYKSGDEGTQAKRAREFGLWASRYLQLPLTFWDERHSSTIAEGYLIEVGISEKKRRARLDALAAQVMLQAYLDATDRSRWDRESSGSHRMNPNRKEPER